MELADSLDAYPKRMRPNEIPNLETVEKYDDPKNHQMFPILDLASGADEITEKFTTGFRMFDDALGGGFIPGQLIVISGVPGEGKTLLAQTFTYELVRAGHAVSWFSYEMDVREIVAGFKSMGIAENFNAYAPKKHESRNINWITERITEGFIRFGTKIAVIDNIDFLEPKKLPDNETRESVLKQIVLELKDLAVQNGWVIILIAHTKKLQPKQIEPDLQDIGYSAGILQLPDTIFLVWRERTKKNKITQGEPETKTLYSFVKIAKNRKTGKEIIHKLMYANGKLNLPATDDDLYGQVSQSFEGA